MTEFRAVHPTESRDVASVSARILTGFVIAFTGILSLGVYFAAVQ